jgi:hypothetical protein
MTLKIETISYPIVKMCDPLYVDSAPEKPTGTPTLPSPKPDDVCIFTL